jgi:chitin synthase
MYTFIIYKRLWYVYIGLLSLSTTLNASSSILNLIFKMCNPADKTYRIQPRNYIYVLPCYNESTAELQNSLNSLVEQRTVPHDKRLIVIICDGKVKGAGNAFSTDILLKNLLQLEETGTQYTYTTWTGEKNRVQVYTGEYTYMNTNTTDQVPVIVLIKEQNVGKRDSLVLIRRACGLYNMQTPPTTDTEFNTYLTTELATIYTTPIDYIIGIDADTIFDYNCTYELIQGLDQDANVHGCVGYVDISRAMNFFSPFVLYQYAEYTFAQCLRRQAQANITKKVSCLSGCNQILRVSIETCGEKILNKFNYYPQAGDNILTHIRSYASEDRNHVCNMLALYPYVKTTQTLKAVAYTAVPTNVAVFLSQRRRWNLGANTNDLLLVYLPGINWCERILALVNVLTFALTPFVFLATIYFIISVASQPTMLMLYLSIILFIPVFYVFLIPIFIRPLAFKSSLYYYFSYLVFFTCSGMVSLGCYTYALIHMDNFSWGKTRLITKAMGETEYESMGQVVTIQNKTAYNDEYLYYVGYDYDYDYLTIESMQEGPTSVAGHTSDALSTSVAGPTSDALSTSVAVTISVAVPTSDAVSTSETVSTSDAVTTSVALSTSDAVPTSVAVTTSDAVTTSVAVPTVYCRSIAYTEF